MTAGPATSVVLAGGLSAGSTVYWSVQWWDAAGSAAPRSAAAEIRVGISERDWNASAWISGAQWCARTNALARAAARAVDG